MELRDIALLVGIVLGALIILAVLAVYLRRKSLGTGELVLSVLGVLLVGMSVWATAKVKVGPGGVEIETELAELRQEVAQVATATGQVAAVAEDLASVTAEVAESNEATRGQLVALTRDLEERQVVGPEVTREIEAPLARAEVSSVRLRELEESAGVLQEQKLTPDARWLEVSPDVRARGLEREPRERVREPPG